MAMKSGKTSRARRIRKELKKAEVMITTSDGRDEATTSCGQMVSMLSNA